MDKTLVILNKIIDKPKKYLLDDLTFFNIQSKHEDNMGEFELFCRLCYGFAPLCHIKPDFEWISLFNKKIIHGTDPKLDGYFGDLYDYDQKNVELVPLLLMLMLNRNTTWCTYTDEQKQNVILWFSGINKVKLVENNWQFFGLLTNVFLHEIDDSFIPEINFYWNKINSNYIGDGWYEDGNSRHIDYYLSFGYHFYSLLLVYFNPEFAFADEIKKRAILFAHNYIHFFDDDGCSIPYGRSLIYRFAQTSVLTRRHLYI